MKIPLIADLSQLYSCFGDYTRASLAESGAQAGNRRLAGGESRKARQLSWEASTARLEWSLGNEALECFEHDYY